ncbi:hypothetical protein HDC35_003567 [Sphingopyxis sp. JAI128]|nr:hypothetical protein [Sphingopyxis sp. JAI128]
MKARRRFSVALAGLAVTSVGAASTGNRVTGLSANGPVAGADVRPWCDFRLVELRKCRIVVGRKMLSN